MRLKMRQMGGGVATARSNLFYGRFFVLGFSTFYGCGDEMAKNGGAGLAITVPRSLDSGWDKTIEYNIKRRLPRDQLRVFAIEMSSLLVEP
ncbi:hypothetical protein Tco_1204160 [Tanacetum coccineum]